MQLSCLYHATQEMRVTDDEELYYSLLATGEWFDHPSLKAKENMNEKPKQNAKSGRPRKNPDDATGGDEAGPVHE